MKVGIIGLPNVGKSTLFNTLTKSNAAVSNFPFTTIEPNVGIASLEDRRLEKLGKLFQPEKLTPATVNFVDIAGLVKGASQGAGLGNKFLSHIREVDILVQVVRAFSDDRIVNTIDKAGPKDEIDIIELELILSDMEQVKRSREKYLGKAKCGDKEAAVIFSEIDELSKLLDGGKPLREKEGLVSKISASELRDYQFHTAKSILYLFNINELTKEEQKKELADFVKNTKKSESLFVNIKVENELMEFDEEERNKFRAEMGIAEGIKELTAKAYGMLGLITFYTVVGKEIRAWPITMGTAAKAAAGKIHTDMEKGFIRAEVYGFEELEKYGSEKALSEKGIIRTEGKDYIINDGDIVKFKYSD